MIKIFQLIHFNLFFRFYFPSGNPANKPGLEATIKKLTELDVSYKKITADYNKSLTVIKDYELKLNGFNGKVNELTTANNQLVMVKTKLEKEFGQVSKDCDDIVRELKLADDRAN